MRGDDNLQEGIFSYISPEKRVPANHPLRPIRKIADACPAGAHIQLVLAITMSIPQLRQVPMREGSLENELTQQPAGI
jgi:hypothetical protein